MRALATSLAIVSLAALCACKGSGSYLYIGQRYEPARGCLDARAAVDVLSGDDPGTSCALKCLLATAGADGGGEVYVSTACPPYPQGFDTGGASAVCASAIAAFQRKDACLVDGGSSAPPPDAGGD